MDDLLQLSDITDNIVIIKINKRYNPDMSDLALYEATRGIWHRKVESVDKAKYCLSVFKGTVVEVFEIDKWLPAGTLEYITREINWDNAPSRIEFSGKVADEDVRKKYIGKSVKLLYKNGEADPVKFIPAFSDAHSSNFVILDASKNISFNTIYEAINYCLGTNYTGWMKACWPNSMGNGKFRIWFPKLAEIKNGKEVSASFGCLNTISPDWNFVYFDDEKESYDENSPKFTDSDLIFAKEPNSGAYIFRGVYISDYDLSTPNHYISRRIATKVKVYKQPVFDIEIDKTSIMNIDINYPVEPYNSAVSGSSIMFTCSRCRNTFKKANRCPECGQLVKI